MMGCAFAAAADRRIAKSHATEVSSYAEKLSKNAGAIHPSMNEPLPTLEDTLTHALLLPTLAHPVPLLYPPAANEERERKEVVLHWFQLMRLDCSKRCQNDCAAQCVDRLWLP
jgi:hypothetical protein